MKQYVVIGAGRFGSAVAVTLSKKGKQVMVLDKDEQVVQRLSEIVTQALLTKSTYGSGNLILVMLMLL